MDQPQANVDGEHEEDERQENGDRDVAEAHLQAVGDVVAERLPDVDCGGQGRPDQDGAISSHRSSGDKSRPQLWGLPVPLVVVVVVLVAVVDLGDSWPPKESTTRTTTKGEYTGPHNLQPELSRIIRFVKPRKVWYTLLRR